MARMESTHVPVLRTCFGVFSGKAKDRGDETGRSGKGKHLTQRCVQITGRAVTGAPQTPARYNLGCRKDSATL